MKVEDAMTTKRVITKRKRDKGPVITLIGRRKHEVLGMHWTKRGIS